MRRTSVTFAVLLVLGLSSSAQWLPRRIDPKTDPKAFTIITQADLDDALSRISRLKAQLKDTKDAEERKFLVEAILKICQDQLNEDRNESGVVVVERTDQIVVPEEESVYDMPIRWQGAFSAIEGQIRSLGKEGLDRYEAIYGPRAHQLLDQALQTRLRDRIEYLNRRFGLTRAGIRAATVVAVMYWEEGETSKAARYLERVLALTELVSSEQQAYVAAWLAHCYASLGERANLVRLIENTVALRELEVDEGGTRVKLGSLLERKLLEARDATTDTIDKLGVEWPGGNYSNTGLHEKPSDYKQIAWSRVLPQLSATRASQEITNYEESIVPPQLPVFDGDMFYVNTGDRLVAYDLVAGTGAAADKPAWVCKPFETKAIHWRVIEPDPSLIMPVSMYRGTVFAAIENPLSQQFHSKDADPMFGLWSHYPKVHRALCAVDGATGRLLWKLGGQYEGNEFDTINFLSAVVHEGTLYAIASRAEQQAEIFVFALDPDDGEVLWDLRVCYGQQETTMFGRPAREPHPSLPCFAGGRMYLCTNIGGVVAVELATRSINWISRYEYVPRPTSKYLETFYRTVTWFNSPTIYAEHKGKSYLVVAPTDANKMFALDPYSGRILWSLLDEDLEGGRAMVGVRNGTVYVGSGGGYSGIGGSRLCTVDLDKGRVTNALKITPIDRGNILGLAGRPCMAGNRLLWPGKEWGDDRCTIAEIDLDKLKVVGSAYVANDYDGYNVFAQHGVVFTISGNNYTEGKSQISARFDSKALLAVARETYTSSPDNAEAAVRYGLLTMRMGDREEAVKALKHAFEAAGKPPMDTRSRDRAGRALVAAWLELADKALNARKYLEALGFVQNAREYSTTRSQLSDCFTREEAALQGAANVKDLEEFYSGLIAEEPDFGVGTDPEIPAGLHARIKLAELLESHKRDKEAVARWQEVQQGPARLSIGGLSLRALAIARIRAIIARGTRDVYAAQDAAANTLLADASEDAWRRVLEEYPLSTGADEAALELANLRLKAFYPAEGVTILRNALDENSARPRTSELNALLALCYAAAGEQLRARLLAARILRDSPNGELKVGGKTRSFSEILKPLTLAESEAGSTATLPRLPAELELLWSREWDISGFVRLQPQPPTMPQARIYVGDAGQSGTFIRAIDAQTGEDAWADQVPVTVEAVHRTPRGTLIVQRQGFSLYDDEGNETWTTPGGGIVFQASLSQGMLVYNTQVTNTRTNTILMRVTALEAATGGRLWTCDLEGTQARWIAQCPQGVLVTLLGNETSLVLLNPETGAEIARHTLATDSRLTSAPVVSAEHVAIIDNTGKLTRVSLSDMKPVSTFETRVRFPTLVQMVEADYLVAGLVSAGRFTPEGKQVWYNDNPQNESVTGHVLLKQHLVVGTRNSSAVNRLTSYALSDGKQAFSYLVPRANDSDRVELVSTVAFDDGLVALFTDRRIIDGRMQIRGFRLLALNADGTERFSWEYEEHDAPPFVQLAVTDNYIIVTADKTTFGFGRRD